MQILKVYDNGPPATTHKYELKDKDRFRLTARPKLCNIWKGQNKRAVTVMHPNYPAVSVIFLSWRSSRKSVHCRCHLILTMMALVFLGGGTLLTALSFQVLVPSEEKKSSCMVVFFYYDRGVEIINDMTLKHCHREGKGGQSPKLPKFCPKIPVFGRQFTFWVLNVGCGVWWGSDVGLFKNVSFGSFP